MQNTGQDLNCKKISTYVHPLSRSVWAFMESHVLSQLRYDRDVLLDSTKSSETSSLTHHVHSPNHIPDLAQMWHMAFTRFIVLAFHVRHCSHLGCTHVVILNARISQLVKKTSSHAKEYTFWIFSSRHLPISPLLYANTKTMCSAFQRYQRANQEGLIYSRHGRNMRRQHHLHCGMLCPFLLVSN